MWPLISDPARQSAKVRRILAAGIFFAVIGRSDGAIADDEFPIVADGIRVALFAREPLVRNPCAIAFDARGRLTVGMGPQYRKPRPDTPGDSVFLLVDTDDDGAADERIEFATGFNSIQGLAWRSGKLWIANAPDLSVVRDIDGDDIADEYIRLYTDLGNLEHGLHGLHHGPDGKLWMSKGNSKGLTELPHRVAPRPFRELWGVRTPDDTPDFPAPVRFDRDSYRRAYHDPEDDWGLCGGVLRANPDGSELQIVSRGFRNPWDIAYDDGFDWLGTDNDQTHGDKIFAPFYGAHFGWGHAWSYDWKGDEHLPTAPSAGPLFEGSGTGVTYCGIDRYPEHLRGVFLINDWLRREVLIYRPRWQGAWMRAAETPLGVLAHAGGGRSMEKSSGRSFDPVDIELGPDGAIWISSWGRQYGAHHEDGRIANEGRIYRLWPESAPPEKPTLPRDPWRDLGTWLPTWRAEAQDAILREGRTSIERLLRLLDLPDAAASKSLETWAAWTLGRIAPEDSELDALFAEWAGKARLNLRLQALRILSHRMQLRRSTELPPIVQKLLRDPEPRVRHEAVLALHTAGDRRAEKALVDLAAREQDRVVAYSTWQALRALLPVDRRHALLEDKRALVRRAALLGLLEDDLLEEKGLDRLRRDDDGDIARLVARRLDGKASTQIKGPPIGLRVQQSTRELDQPTTIERALAALEDADPVRGRELFLSSQRAGCSTCHQMEGIGNVWAPSLADIGARADARTIVQSILEPSASITEGFVQQVAVLRDGSVVSGIVIEETGLALRFALSDGHTTRIARADLLRHETSPLSAMPDAYAKLLTPREVADICAWLLEQKATSRSAAPILRADCRGKSWGSEENGFHIVCADARLDVSLDGEQIFSYHTDHAKTRRPFFAHLRTTGGVQVTRSFPPVEGVDATDHAWMHPGLSLGFAKLCDENFWHGDRGVVVHEGFLGEPRGGDTGRFVVRNRWLGADRSLVCIEETRYEVRRDEAGWLLSIDTHLTGDRKLVFGVKEEMGLTLRIATPLTVRAGGTIRSAKGGVDEKGTWGRVDTWWDYLGDVKAKTEETRSVGVLLMSGPGNPPTWSHSRDYGVLVANPFPVDIPENRGQRVEVEGKVGLRLRFGVLVHDHGRREDFDAAKAYGRYWRLAE